MSMDITRERYLEEVRRFFEEDIPQRFNSPVREGQLIMALKVAEEFWDERVLACEAGTGVGKSLAYLVPAMLWRLHGGEAIPLVATYTINLQEQLLKKDIPFMAAMFEQIYGKKLQIVQAVGASNYLCKRRFNYAFSHSKDFPPPSRLFLDKIAAILNREDDRYGLFADEEDLGEPITGVRSDFSCPPSVWGHVCYDNWMCGRSRCTHYNRCFLFNDRRRLFSADLIVANHSLVLADAALRREGAAGILPSLERLIFDEAHHLESVATEQLSYSFMASDCYKLLAQLSEDGDGGAEERSLMSRAQDGLMYARPEDTSSWVSVLDRLQYGCLENLRDEVVSFFKFLSDVFTAQQTNSSKIQLTPALLESESLEELTMVQEAANLEARWRECSALLGELANLADKAGEDTAELCDAAEAAQDQAKRLADSLNRSLDIEDQEWIHWGEIGQTLETPWSEDGIEKRKFISVGLRAAPMQIGSYLNEHLFKDAKTIILTSATLKVNKSMSFALSALGLAGQAKDGNDDTGVDEVVCPSPFNYRKQAFLGVVTDIDQKIVTSQDKNTDFWMQILEPLVRLLKGLQGRTLILFTSYRSMEMFSEILSQRLEGENLRVLRQGGDKNRTALIEEFRTTPRTVLLGTDSFWEGVDVPGEALQCVVVCRLPFVVPSDPIHQARMDRIKAKGGDSFQEYSVPLATTKLRQGVGRLIRSVDDKGIILILDSRVFHRTYGRRMANNLPTCTCQPFPLDVLVENGLAWMQVPGSVGRYTE